jgi:hypothetical protein
MLQRAWMLGVVMAATSCATELDDDDAADALITDATAVLDQGVIVGELDWQDAASLPAGVVRTASRAAGYVSIPEMRSRCSGFLIGRDVVMTNHHCVPDASAAVGVVVNFTYETTWDQTGAVRCDEFIGASQTLDYALLRCRGTPGDTFGSLSIDDRTLSPNRAIALLHQQCDFYANQACPPTKKVSPGKVTGVAGNRITHDADMLGGSSGGGIIDPTTGAVIAINNAHVTRGTTGGRGTTNIGVPMSLIVPDIRARFPDVLGTACAKIPAAGRDLDEDDGCTTLGGDTRWWRAVEGAGADGDLAWTGTTTNAAPANFARWTLDVEAAGTYELSVYIDAATASATGARYTVTSATGTTAVMLNQAAVTTSGFVSLGRFSLAPGRPSSVRVDDNTGVRGEQLVVDALRVRPVSTTTTPPPPPTTCTQVRVVDTTALNVRRTPDTSQAAIGSLAGGEVVTRLRTVTGASVRGTTNWYEIEKPGLRGYVSASYAACVN